VLVQAVILRLEALGAGKVHQLDGNPEHVVFSLPRELQKSQ
jgi:hypothetical protein